MDRTDFLLMAHLAKEGQATALELEAVTGLKRSAVNKRLLRLRDNELVVGKKSGEQVSHRPRYYFSLTNDGFAMFQGAAAEQLEEQRILAELVKESSALAMQIAAK